MITTIKAVIIVSLRVGQTIFAASVFTWFRNWPGFIIAIDHLRVLRRRTAAGVRRVRTVEARRYMRMRGDSDGRAREQVPRVGPVAFAQAVRTFARRWRRGCAARSVAGVEGFEPTTL